MTDNTEIIKKLISDCGRDNFYMVQIIHRSKDGDNPFSSNSKKGQHTIKTYYVSSPEYLEKKMDEIKELCHIFNARAYINLNMKSWKQVATKSIELLAQGIMRDDWSGVKSVIDSSCGQTGACDRNKSWIIDIDTKDTGEIDVIKNILTRCEPFETVKFIALIPTVHGYHIISRPFNKQRFNQLYQKQIDIHDNNPTLLYADMV